MRYSKKLAEQIALLLEKDTYSIYEICAITSISRNTFYRWKKEKPDFAEMLSDALRSRDENLAAEARRSLRKKINGFTVKEVKTTYITPKDEEDQAEMKIKEKVVKEKYHAPDTSAIVFALTNRDSENWKNKQSTELAGTDNQPIIITVTNSETKKELEKLQKEK